MFKKLWRWIKSLFAGSSGSPGSGDEPVSIKYSDFPFDLGGFNGKRATGVAGAQIGNLIVSRSGRLSYRWRAGGCENIGASGPTDASATVCCLFCLGPDGKWHGGKFDWISTSRTTRSLENCHNYSGWKYDYVTNARKFAFVIVSKSGNYRTNVAFCD